VVLLLAVLLVQDVDWTKLRSQLDHLADADFAARKTGREITVSKELLLKAPKDQRATAALALAVLGEAKWKDLVVEMTKDEATRAVAFEALGGLKVDARFLIDALTDEPRVAFAAARSLGRIDATRLQRVFDDVDRALLESRTPERLRRRIACVMGLDPARSTYVIRKGLVEADPAVATCAFAAVTQLDPALASTLDIADELRAFRGRIDIDAALAERAALLAIDRGLAAPEELIAFLRHSSAQVRRSAIEKLAPPEPLGYDVGRWLDWLKEEAIADDGKAVIEGWIVTATGTKPDGDRAARIASWGEWWTKNRYQSLFTSAEKAATRGAEFLRAQMKGDHWEEKLRGSVGLTALAVYTLLKCGAKPEDAAISETLKWLHAQDVHGESGEGGTYRAAVMALAYAEAKDLKWLPEVVRYLESSQHRNGGWGYHADDKEHADTSNSQMALLGLRAATHAGVKVTPAAFTRALDFFKSTRMKDGGWAYTREESYPAMTAAGLCGMLMAKPGDAKEDPALTWLAEHWIVEGAKPVKGQYLYLSTGDDPLTSQLSKGSASPFVTTNYWLWCLERACMAGGLDRVGEHDWYVEGATLLMRRMTRSGQCKGPLGLADHCFAMLFLKRAYVPVASGQK